MDMLFGNVFNEESREQETKCYGFSMKQFIEKEMGRKRALGLTNTLVGIQSFEDLAIPFSYDSHDRVFPILSSPVMKTMKGGGGKRGHSKGHSNMEVIPDHLFDHLFGLVAQVKGSVENTGKDIGKRRTKRSYKSHKA